MKVSCWDNMNTSSVDLPCCKAEVIPDNLYTSITISQLRPGTLYACQGGMLAKVLCGYVWDIINKILKGKWSFSPKAMRVTMNNGAEYQVLEHHVILIVFMIICMK